MSRNISSGVDYKDITTRNASFNKTGTIDSHVSFNNSNTNFNTSMNNYNQNFTSPQAPNLGNHPAPNIPSLDPPVRPPNHDVTAHAPSGPHNNDYNSTAASIANQYMRRQ